eukprot:jgi/Psemu1/257415/estExt_Genewise1Plus.C_2220037
MGSATIPSRCDVDGEAEENRPIANANASAWPAAENPNPIPDFGDARSAYDTKSTPELIRAALCFRSCRIRWLVANAEGLLSRIGRTPVGGIGTTTLVHEALRATLYGQFCAGEDRERMLPVLETLERSGVGTILDYAAEESDDGGGTTGDKSKSKREQEYEYEYDRASEERCDRHLGNFLQCIRDAEASTTHHGYAAIKMTALGNPNLLARLSTAIAETKRLFAVFDTNGDGHIGREEFELAYNRLFVDGDVRIKEIFEEFDPQNTGFIDYIAWSMMLSPEDLPQIVKKCQAAGKLFDACPTEVEIELLHAVYDRGRTLAEKAAESGVRLLIDAEQVRYQPTIDHLVLDLQRRFNNASHSDHPIVYHTYQCYLQDSLERLRTDVARSERFGYHFGAKLVRGAYLESERALAASRHLPDPIHPTIEATHECYDTAVDYLLQHSTESENGSNTEIMCATHNRASIVHAIESMNYYGIDRRASTLSFAQLYGMSDQLTFNLGKHGYRAYKYVPYGEVDEVVPYLLRRARENSAIVGGAATDLELIKAELARRFRAFVSYGSFKAQME